jgi:hypothetical protein
MSEEATPRRASRAKTEATPEAPTETPTEAATEGTTEGEGAQSTGAEESASIPVTQLVEESTGFLGVPSHTAMGALSGDLSETMTVDEAKMKVDEWLQQPVKVEEG